jgi:group I intron endonuclease
MIRFNNLSINIVLTRNLSRGLPKLTQSPIKSYDNADIHKKLIFKENLNKSFVYRWVNKINGKEYLGSTSNAKSRLRLYYDIYSLNSNNMPIYKALLKYGHSNFIFEIIEYCSPEDAIKKEQYFLDLFDFDYNVLEKANSLLGFKHTSETIAKMKGRTNALGFKHSIENIENLRNNQINKTHSEENKIKMREIWAERKINKILLNDAAKEENQIDTLSFNTNDSANKILKPRKLIKGKLVVITNIETNISTEYISISEAALALNITRTTLRNYIKNQTIFNLLKRDNSGKVILKEKFLIKVKDK